MPTAKGLPNTFFLTKITLNAAFAKGQMTKSFHFVLIGFFFVQQSAFGDLNFSHYNFYHLNKSREHRQEAWKMFKTFSKVTG